MKKKFRRIIALLAAVVLVIPSPVMVRATDKSSDQAIAWVQSQLGKSLDQDGVYGAQCVDLIKSYYQYLGVSPVSGNGKDYASNSLPAGWNRVQGGQPQKGDILVYGGNDSNPYGHVAIYEADRVTYHQNFNYHAYVEKITYKYNAISNPYWGYIRPNWSSTNVTMTFQDFKLNSVSQTNAELYTKVLNPSKAAVTEVGCRLMDEAGTTLATYTEGVSLTNRDWIYITCNINTEAKYTLAAGKTYKAEFYAVAGGKRFVDQPRSFSTTAPADPQITFEEYKVDSLTETNAELYTKVMNPTKQTVTNVGCYLYDDAGTLLKKYSEDISLSTSFVNLTCNFNTEMGYTLEPGKNYKAVFYVIVGGKEYKDGGHTITTPKSQPAEQTVIALKEGSSLSIGENQMVTGIKAGENTVQSLRSAFANSKLYFAKADGTELADTDKVGTGTVISIKNGNEVTDSITAVVSGDINGDGEIGTMDITMLSRSVVGTYGMNSVQKLAGDVHGDQKINNKDISKLLKVIVGKTKL